MNYVIAFLRKEEGALALEYALILALVSLALVAGATLIGGQICAVFNGIRIGLGNTPAGPFTATPC